MAMSHSASAYIDQWLHAATKGKVTAHYAMMVPDRVKFLCHECGLTLTANVPNTQTIDYGVQEFVRQHAHKLTKQIEELSMKQANYGPPPGPPKSEETLKFPTGRKFK